MADILTPEQRSAQMSRIKSSNTKLEVLVRRGLHARGLRYRLGGCGLPGSPDVVLPRFRTALFINGCFWHGHECPLFRLPKTRSEFWGQKIQSNKTRDQKVTRELVQLGWKVITVWECSYRRASPSEISSSIDDLASEIRVNVSST